MQRAPILTLVAVALLPLAACNKSQPEVVDTRAPDPQASAMANAAPVELPPAISASVTFRCQPGNSLMYVDFHDGDKMIVLRTTKDGSPTVLNAPAAGEPYVSADGMKLTGNAKSATIVLADGSSHACKA